MREYLALGLIVTTFLALSAYYTVTSPLYSRPDEPCHYDYVLHLRAGQGLPAVDTSWVGARNDNPVEMEAHQPPLYYAAVAALSYLAPAGPDPVPETNPYFWYTPEGQRHLWLSSYVTSLREAPVFFTGRFVAVLSGAAALVFAYLLLRLFLAWPLAALGVALMGLNPQFIYISSSFSNDMPGVATAHLGLWQIGIALQSGLTPRRGIVIGLAIAVATLTKVGGFGLLAPLGAVALWQAWRQRQAAPIAWAALAATVVAVVGSWWFWRNWQLYDNPFAVNTLTILLGPAPGPADWPTLSALLDWLWKSYWVDFSPGGRFFAEAEVYWAIGVLLALALLGLGVYLARDGAARPFFALLWGWFAIVFFSVLGVTVTTGIVMGGGRLLLPAAVAVGATLAVGLHEVARRRWLPVAVLAVAVGIYAAIAPARYPDPAYPQLSLVAELDRFPAQLTEVYFGDPNFQLLGYDVELVGADAEEQSLAITYYWRTLKPTDRNLSVLILLVGGEEAGHVVRADFKTYPTYGAFPTSRWRRDRILVDYLSLPLPPPGKPADGSVITGLYDGSPEELLPAVDRAGNELPQTLLTLAEIRTSPSGERELVVRGRGAARVRTIGDTPGGQATVQPAAP